MWASISTSRGLESNEKCNKHIKLIKENNAKIDQELSKFGVQNMGLVVH